MPPDPILEAPPEARTVMRWRAVTEYRCGWCGRWFEARTPSARYCSNSHRSMADRRRRELGMPTRAERARKARAAAHGMRPPRTGEDGGRG